MFHCMDRPFLVYSFIHQWTFGLFPHLAIVVFIVIYFDSFLIVFCVSAKGFSLWLL